jgi:hypothetical protein
VETDYSPGDDTQELSPLNIVCLSMTVMKVTHSQSFTLFSTSHTVVVFRDLFVCSRLIHFSPSVMNIN